MFELLQAELKRIWTEFIRYPVDSISSVLVTSLFFYGLFLSVRYIAGPNLIFGNRLDAMVVGYVLWTLVVFILQGIALELQVEAQTGTLEQVFLSPFGTLRVLLVRAIAHLTLYLVLIVGVLLLTMILTGRYLHFSPSLLLPLSAVLLGTYGLALIVGALTLLFKRVQQLSGLLQFALLFLLTLPVETWKGPLQGLKLLLPMTVGSGILRDLMARNQSLDFSGLALAFLNGLGYFVLGVLVFRWAERKVKHQAILSGY
jgi:ABC-2 type transport system permease protein